MSQTGVEPAAFPLGVDPVSYTHLDGVLPKLIPLALTLGLFFLMKKKNWKPVTCIALLLVIGLVGAFFGIFA